jgi:hypothetical protein
MTPSQTSETFWEGGLLFECMSSKDDYEVYQRTDDGIEEIGSVIRIKKFMQEPYWYAVSPDGDIYRPYRTRILAAQALTRKTQT